jgi:LruC domain-containing protein
VVDLKFDFAVKAVGASLDNGFGFQYESLTPGLLASVTGSVLEEGYVSLAANGTEDGQSKVVVIVTESINDLINRPGGSFFNTVPGNPQGTSDTINIVMTFDEPQDPALIDLEYFNPFIIKSKDRSVEIHLPGYPPTDLMDMDLLGTGDDASNPIAGVYYVTTTNLPWAMFLVEPFDYPVEKTQIIDAYNYFGAWAESGGSLYNDWYLDYSGYRNNTEIY